MGFAFNRRIITELLRDELKFDGLVLSDFGLVTDAQVFGKPFPARAWGVEQLPRADRIARLLDAGVDQFGGENDSELLVDLVESGRIDSARVAESASRVVELQLRLGLWDDPADPTGDVGQREHLAMGLRAQARATVVLDDKRGMLPLGPAMRVALDGLAAEGLPASWTVVEPQDADVVFVRLAAPFEPRDNYFLESAMEQGSLAFSADVVERIADLAVHAPIVLIVTLTRPAILTPLIANAAIVLADFGASDAAIIDALTGAVPSEGRLPFELPRTMAAVAASRPDVASDTVAPLFPVGWRASSPTSSAKSPEETTPSSRVAHD